MIFLNASGGGVSQSEKRLCEQPSNHNYTQMMRLRRKCRNFPCRSTLFIFLWVYFQGHSNNSPLLIASSKEVCRRYTYFGFNIQRILLGCHWLTIPSVRYSLFFISAKLLIQILLAISTFHILYPFESASPGRLFSDLDGVSTQSEAYNISSALFLAFARAICFKDLGFV